MHNYGARLVYTYGKLVNANLKEKPNDANGLLIALYIDDRHPVAT